jgi:hypothetical protein
MAHTGVLLHGTAGADVAQFQPVVNTSWNVGSSITTGANVNLLMGWSSAMQVNGFDPAQAYLSHYTAGSWNTNAISSATLSGGSYSLALTGVTSFSPFAVFGKNIALGVASISASDMLYVYPNPATDRLTIQTGSTDKITVEISDLNGQIVSKYELAGSNNTIEVANLSTGSYLVRVLNNGNSSVKKFIKI